METKQCNKCLELKNLSEFYRTTSNQRSLDGLRKQCKQCHSSFSHNQPNRKEVANNYYKRKKEEDPAVFMWKQAKHRAKYDYKDMEFTIMVEHILIPERCPYMGVPFQPLDKKYGYSLDRIDSDKGYTPDNIQVISRIANIMKNNATEQELISFAKGVLNVHSKEVGCDAHAM